MFASLDGSDRHHEQLELFAWRQRARLNAQSRLWKLQNPRRVREYYQQWIAANPDRAHKKWIKGSRLYRQRHPEKARASQARWRAKYPDKVRAMWRRNSNKYYARMKLDPAWQEKKRAYEREYKARKRAERAAA
jgi:hypothetical protein